MHDSLKNRSFICKKCPREKQAPVFGEFIANFMFNTVTENAYICESENNLKKKKSHI